MTVMAVRFVYYYYHHTLGQATAMTGSVTRDAPGRRWSVVVHDLLVHSMTDVGRSDGVKRDGPCTARFTTRVTNGGECRVRQCLFRRDTILGKERQQALQQPEDVGVGGRELGSPVNAWTGMLAPQKVTCLQQHRQERDEQ